MWSSRCKSAQLLLPHTTVDAVHYNHRHHAHRQHQLMLCCDGSDASQDRSGQARCTHANADARWIASAARCTIDRPLVSKLESRPHDGTRECHMATFALLHSKPKRGPGYVCNGTITTRKVLSFLRCKSRCISLRESRLGLTWACQHMAQKAKTKCPVVRKLYINYNGRWMAHLHR